MLMQLWRPEFELVGKSSGSWYHTHTRLTALFPGLRGLAGIRNVKEIWILL